MPVHIYVNKVHFPVTTLGPGRRVGIWFQGCGIGCPGCISKDTWARDLGKTTVEALCASLDPWLQQADGVTISGGEPLDQLEALGALLHWMRSEFPSLDVLLYTGYAGRAFEGRIGALRAIPDAVINGPYQPRSGQTLPWRGSDNQELITLTQLGKERIERAALEQTSKRSLDLCVDAGSGDFWFAGIPGPGDFEKLTALLAAKGITSHTSAEGRIYA